MIIYNNFRVKCLIIQNLNEIRKAVMNRVVSS